MTTTTPTTALADRVHELKTDPAVFAAVLSGAKTHEIRANDRGFAVGDALRLRETASTGEQMRAGAPLEYTGREITRTVSHVLTGYGLQDGWCILSLAAQPVAPEETTCPYCGKHDGTHDSAFPHPRATTSPQIAEVAELPKQWHERIAGEINGMTTFCAMKAEIEELRAIAASRRAAAEKEVRALDALDGMGFTYDSEIGWLPPTATAPASAGQAAATHLEAVKAAIEAARDHVPALSIYDAIRTSLAASTSAGQAAPAVAEPTPEMIAAVKSEWQNPAATYASVARAVLAAQPAEGAGQAGQVADERTLFEATIPLPEKVERGDPWYFGTCATRATDAQLYNYKWMGWQARAKIAERAAAPAEQTAAARDVLAERRRQVEQEGWTPEHDTQYEEGELSRAAACYALAGDEPHGRSPNDWPWEESWWKPRDDRANLVRAGALILADIERLDRATHQPSAQVKP